MAIRVAIIGCGGMARGHLNAYLGIQEVVPGKVELVTMCDIRCGETQKTLPTA